MELTNTNRSRAYPDRLGMDVEKIQKRISVFSFEGMRKGRQAKACLFCRIETSFLYDKNAPRGSHCVGMEGCRFRDPTQAENPALQDSITIQFTRERRFMSKRSCAAAESIEDASLRMARVNGRRMRKAPRMTGALRKILQKCLRLGLALKTPLCYNIHSGQ